MIELIAITLVTFHMPGDREVQINPAAVQQLISPHREKNRLVVPGVKCVIRMTSGYVSVVETCDEVKKALEGSPP